VKLVINDDGEGIYIEKYSERVHSVDEVTHIPKSLYEEWKFTSIRYYLLERLLWAYKRKDNLAIIELTAELKGLIK
jgi:hypothetical protein